MGVPKRLTEMQMKFAHEIVTNEGRKNGFECAKDAGYAEDSARVRASELQNPKRFPLVVKYIGELREEYQKKYAVTFERHISELGKIRQDALAKGAWSAATNAEGGRWPAHPNSSRTAALGLRPWHLIHTGRHHASMHWQSSRIQIL